MKVKATERAMSTATRVASFNKGDGNGDQGGGQETATKAMAAATTVVDIDEGDGNGNEGEGRMVMEMVKRMVGKQGLWQ